MTEKEFIEKAIEWRKEGCDEVFRDQMCEISSCDECPMNTVIGDCVYCSVDDYLLDEIIRLREEKAEKVETNLEHYFTDKWTRSYEGYLDKKRLLLCCDESTMNDFNNNTFTYDLIDWLLSPYEPPKKYQMTQFEYDLIKTYRENHYANWAIEDLVMLRYMESLGYFKNIPKDTRIRDILENAEVVEE